MSKKYKDMYKLLRQEVDEAFLKEVEEILKGEQHFRSKEVL